jgi:hypothetical protein
MSMVRTISIVGLLLFSLAADAAMVLGPGSASCVTWNGDRQRNESHSQLNQAWVLGFVTAYNLYKPASQNSSPRPMDSRAMMVWVDNYCDANPLKDIFDAAQALIEDLEGRAP